MEHIGGKSKQSYQDLRENKKILNKKRERNGSNNNYDYNKKNNFDNNKKFNDTNNNGYSIQITGGKQEKEKTDQIPTKVSKSITITSPREVIILEKPSENSKKITKNNTNSKKNDDVDEEWNFSEIIGKGISNISKSPNINNSGESKSFLSAERSIIISNGNSINSNKNKFNDHQVENNSKNNKKSPSSKSILLQSSDNQPNVSGFDNSIGNKNNSNILSDVDLLTHRSISIVDGNVEMEDAEKSISNQTLNSNVSKKEEKTKEPKSSTTKSDSIFRSDMIKFGEKPKEIETVHKKSSPSQNQNNSVGKYPSVQSKFPWIGTNSQFLNEDNIGMIRLHYEIIDFYNFLKPTEDEDYKRKRTITILTDIIKKYFPDWKVKEFGSFPNKIHLPDSDVDIVVITSSKSEETEKDQIKYLRKLAKKLVDENCVEYINVIEARVPIIRATLKETKINLDISANRNNGYEAKKVIKKVLKDFPLLRPLIYVLKYFLRQRKLNETFTGGISSFLLFNLLFAYWQHMIKKDKENIPNLTLGHILVGFFQFYAFEFNYDEVGLSIRHGGFFFKKKTNNWYDSKRPWLLSVENFQDTEQDIGRSAFKFKKVLDCFKQARDALYYPSTHPIESFLGQFIHVDTFLIERNQINKTNI